MVVYNIIQMYVYLYVFVARISHKMAAIYFCFVNDLVILCIHRMRVFYKTRRLLEPTNDV